MAYASIQDVEARGGVVFDEDDTSVVEAFISDFSEYIDEDFELAGKTPTETNLKTLKTIVARRALDYFLYAGKNGVSSLTESVGDTSQTVSYESSSVNSDDFLYLTARDKMRLGLNKNGGFVSWAFVEKGAN